MSPTLQKQNDDYIPVNNAFLIKHIKDNPDDINTLLVVGTFQQVIYDRNEEFGKDKSFTFRINDIEANNSNGYIQQRKQVVDKTTKVYTTTFDVKAPLEISENIFDCFPFTVVAATLTVELNSAVGEGKNNEQKVLRPELHLSKTKGGNISIHKPDRIKFHSFKSWAENNLASNIFGKDQYNERIRRMIQIKMDQSMKYDYVTYAPKIQYIMKKDKCAKFRVSFFIIEQGVAKVVRVVAPMFLIAFMNFFHVWENVNTDSTDYLANSATYALAIVFLLEYVVPDSRKDEFLNSNTLYIVTVFIGLMLSSVPARTVGSEFASISYVGAVLFAGSFVIPIVNFVRYLNLRKYLRKRHFIEDFICTKKDQFKYDRIKFEDFFKPVGEVKADPKSFGYKNDDADFVKDITEKSTWERFKRSYKKNKNHETSGNEEDEDYILKYITKKSTSKES